MARDPEHPSVCPQSRDRLLQNSPAIKITKLHHSPCRHLLDRCLSFDHFITFQTGDRKKHVVNACVPASVAGRAAPRTLHASAAVSLLDFTAESCRCFVSAGFSVNHCRVALGRDVSCTLLGGRWPARAPDRTEECGLWDEFTAWLWCGVAGRGPGRLLWS